MDTGRRGPTVESYTNFRKYLSLNDQRIIVGADGIQQQEKVSQNFRVRRSTLNMS